MKYNERYEEASGNLKCSFPSSINYPMCAENVIVINYSPKFSLVDTKYSKICILKKIIYGIQNAHNN